MMHQLKGTVILATALAFNSIGSLSAQQAAPPNIILIMTDDQGWGDLSISGNKNLETPNIDRLAQTGVTFSQFMVHPVCSPTRADLLTGRYHPRGGVYSTSAGGERLDPDETTIADYFKEAGYTTAAYGKWHNGMQPPYHPNARGFDDFYGFCSGHWGNYFSPMLEHNGKIVKGNGYLTDDITNRGIEFISRHKNHPFFLYLPFNTPHSPMQVPDKWWNRFKAKKLEMRHRDPEKEDIPFTRAALAMCENIDWNVGRLVSKVEELGLMGNTIIVYLSDNGPNGWRWNGGMKGRKGSVDEGGVRVPMFIKWEGRLPQGRTVYEVAGAIDFLPTLVDLAGINLKPKKPLDGISLKPLLTNENPEKNDRFLFSHWNGKISVRSNNFRYTDNGQLFDMVNDPGQKTDIAAKIPETTHQMSEALTDWKKNVLSELPETDERPFVVGQPGFQYTHLPARDGIPHGNIKRSNQYPNDSFFTKWTSTSDSITWDIEVPAAGNFGVEIYYTCQAAAVGSVVEITFAGSTLSTEIKTAHNPPLTGMGNDRTARMESYVKDFMPLNAGTIYLPKGKGKLTLKAAEITGADVMDFRLMVFRRI